MTTATRGTPHIKAVRRHNQIVHVHEGIEGRSMKTGVNLWRNCDRQIRDWWKANREQVKADHFAFIEWDVFANFDLSQCIIPVAGLVGRVVETSPTMAWHWWAEIPKLPEEIRRFASSIRPLAVVIASRECLDAIADPRWDHVFKLDIFCELRLATVATASGFMLASSDHLQNVNHFAIDHPGDVPGVFHAIKLAKLRTRS